MSVVLAGICHIVTQPGGTTSHGALYTEKLNCITFSRFKEDTKFKRLVCKKDLTVTGLEPATYGFVVHRSAN